MRILSALLVMGTLSVCPATAQGIWISEGPISCRIAVDSLDYSVCQKSPTLVGNSGYCNMPAMKGGIPHTVTISASGKRTSHSLFPQLSAQVMGTLKVFGSAKAKELVGHCTVTSDFIGKCTVWGNEFYGGGTCSACYGTACYEGTASIRITANAPFKQLPSSTTIEVSQAPSTAESFQ